VALFAVPVADAACALTLTLLLGAFAAPVALATLAVVAEEADTPEAVPVAEAP
jgi:hypothetical protein